MYFVIDGNFFLNRSLHSCSIKKSKRGKMLEGYIDRQKFVEKLLFDFSMAMKSFAPLIEDVIICLDSRSWRKEYLASQLEDDYKGRRVEKAEKIDWEGFTEMRDVFLEIVTNYGVDVCKIKGAEGDDLIYLWCKKLNDEGKSVIYYTADSDLKQLLYYDKEKEVRNVMFSPIKKHIILNAEAYEEHKTEITYEDLLSPSNKNSSQFDDILRQVAIGDYSIQYDNPMEILMEKVVLGDRGDNIANLCRGIGKKKYELIFRAICENFDLNLNFVNCDLILSEEFSSFVSGYISDTFNPKCSAEVMKANVEKNVRVICLHKECIPPSIIDDFNNQQFLTMGELDLESLCNFSKLKDDCEIIDNKTDSIISSYFNDLRYVED